MKKISKKANVWITLFVLMVLALAGATLLIFNLNQGKISAEIGDYVFLNQIYLKENQINFYVNLILEKTINEFDFEKGDAEFINDFKNNLLDYKKEGEYLIKEFQDIEEQADNIIFEDNKIKFKLAIRFDEKFTENFQLVYLYEKDFEKDL